MPITLNHSNISVQYSTGSNYIIETVKSDLYVRDTVGITSNLTDEPTITPSIHASTFTIESFVYSGTLDTKDYTKVFTRDTICDILIVGGGGGGGYDRAAGGGAGGLLLYTDRLVNAGTYTIKVGKGGIGDTGYGARGTLGNGFSSSIEGLSGAIALGGGRGGTAGNMTNDFPNSGGSGGGGAGNAGWTTNTGSSGTSGQGNSGGNMVATSGSFNSAGGGGAGGNGGNGLQGTNPANSGNGGIGRDMSSYFGTSFGQSGWFAGGGGGSQDFGSITSANSTSSRGGQGGGGNAGLARGQSGSNGTAGTGGGGGGGANIPQGSGGNGGSGIVLIRYRNLESAPASINLHKILNFQYFATLSPTQYTLNFPVQTLVDVNNNSNLILQGNYNVNLGATNSSLVPTISNTNNRLIPLPTTPTTNIKVRYHLLNPVRDPNGAQWTYNSSNTNVFHMGSVGIGTTNPEYSLDVRGNIFTSTGGYTQSGLTTWYITSDRRIKENIVKASYEKCLENVKKIELYNFNFKDNCVNTNDKNQLGFIAQEVQQVYPKAVEVGKMTLNTNETIDNVLTLNTTQIKYTLYGAVKELINKVEKLETKINM